MPQISFADLINKYPHSREALLEIAAWLNRHEDATVLYPSVLARETSLDPVSLAKALTLLVREGILRRVYKVTTPSGALADEEFDDPRKIPEQLPDRFDHYFSTAESNVVPVFQMVA
jgi:hypothetical protein